MPFFVTVVIDGLACVFSIFAITCSAGDISHINTDSREVKVLPFLHLAVVPLLLFSSYFFRSFASKQGVWWFRCQKRYEIFNVVIARASGEGGL